MKLSIITINYNNADGLLRTIESIMPHCSEDIEYIIIDGASTDSSIKHIQKYTEQISYLVSEPDKGVFDAMNKGLSKATGDYLLFMNSGDILNKDIDLKKTISHLAGGEDIIFHNIEIANCHNAKKQVNTCPDYIDFKFFAERSLPHQASFIKTEVLKTYGGYNDSMKLAADWAFFADAICLRQCSYKHINECFSTYYLDGISSDSANHALLWEEKEEHIKEHYPLYHSLYKEWRSKSQELYKLKTSVSVRLLKKIGFLKWLKL